MYFKIIIQILLTVLIFALQFSFISGLPVGMNNFNLVLVSLIFVLALKGSRAAIWWALAIGFLADIFSFKGFGVFLISFPVAVIMADFLLNNFFTNSSLYSFFALTILTTVFYEFIFILSAYASGFLEGKTVKINFGAGFFMSFGFQIIYNLAAVLVIFYAINYFTNRLKPVFLEKKYKNLSNKLR